MHYKEILRLKFPNKQAIRFDDDTYEGIVWNHLDNSPNPTKAELDTAAFSLLPNISGNSQTVLVTNFLTDEATDNIVVIPSAIFVNSFFSVTVQAMIGTSIIPLDTSIPTITDGTKLAEITITPKSLTSKFRCSFTGTVDASGNNKSLVFAIFRGQTCIGTSSTNVASSGKPTNMSIDIVDIPAVKTPITYSIRAGVNSNATWYINRISTGVTLGGSSASPFIVMEFE